MSRLTINEAAGSGYTDEIVLSPNDLTTDAGNTTTVVSLPIAKGDVIDGAAINVTEVYSTGSATIKVGTDSGSGVNDDDGLITATRVDQLNTVANSGTRLSVTGVDGGSAANSARVVATGPGNVLITASTALNGDTSGKVRILLSIKRISA